YLGDHPERVQIRAYLAELLWRRDRLAEAQAEFEQFLSDAQQHGVETSRQVHAHTRLMAIAQRNGDAYAEHLNRGIGLYLLAGQDVTQDEAAVERLLCKAAAVLTLAQRARP